MPTIDRLGTEAPVRQGKKARWSYQDGTTTLHTFRGVAAGIEQLYDAYRAYASTIPSVEAVEFDAGRGVGTLSVQENEPGKPVWELYANELALRVEMNPAFSELTAGEVNQAYAAADAAASDDEATASPYDPEARTFGLTDGSDAHKLFQLLCNGNDSYFQSAYVLRKTVVTTSRGAVSASFSNVNKVDAPDFSAASSALIGDLPDGEWLKRAPVVRMIGGHRWQVMQEWWWAPKWSEILYGGTGVP